MSSEQHDPLAHDWRRVEGEHYPYLVCAHCGEVVAGPDTSDDAGKGQAKTPGEEAVALVWAHLNPRGPHLYPHAKQRDERTKL
ncbi:MAG: hypothetical protein H7233_04680 [Pseudorhodobacter sp.]|nr:hypothetical protein [Frankiaceae bacterium]